jgi:hypothetical protein
MKRPLFAPRFFVLCLFLFVSMSQGLLAQEKKELGKNGQRDEDGELGKNPSQRNLRVLLKAVEKYHQAFRRYPSYESLSELQATKKGLDLLVEKKLLKREDLIGDPQKAYGLVAFFLPMPKQAKKPLIIAAQQKPAKDGRLFVGLTNGQILKLNTSNRSQFQKEIQQYLATDLLIKRQIAVNEREVIAVLKSLVTAQSLYFKRDWNRDGAISYGSFEELVRVRLVSPALRTQAAPGYSLTLKLNHDRWSVRAKPKKRGVTGLRTFYVDQSGAIRESDKNPADETSANLGRLKEENSIEMGTDGPSNESAVIQVLKQLINAQQSFRQEDLDGNGLISYGDFKALLEFKLIDRFLAAGKRSGYIFKLTLGAGGDKLGEYLWSVAARPRTLGKKGKEGSRSFYADQSGVIRMSKIGPATKESSVLELETPDDIDKGKEGGNR